MRFVIFNATTRAVVRKSSSLILLVRQGLPDGHCIGDVNRQQILGSDGVWRGADVPEPGEVAA